jgi:hypothetical protein
MLLWALLPTIWIIRIVVGNIAVNLPIAKLLNLLPLKLPVECALLRANSPCCTCKLHQVLLARNRAQAVSTLSCVVCRFIACIAQHDKTPIFTVILKMQYSCFELISDILNCMLSWVLTSVRMHAKKRIC